jgi:hypothetical protein
MDTDVDIRVSINMIYDYILNNKDIIEKTSSEIIIIKNRKDETVLQSRLESELSDTEPTILTLGEVAKLKYLPSYLKSFFNNHTFLHMGVLSKFDDDNTEQDFSFFSSVLSCLNQTFNNMDIINKKKYLKKIFDPLKRDIILEGYSSFGYGKMKWDKKDVHRDLDNYKTTKQTIRYFVDYLHINVFILDVENDSIIFTGGNFIPYKKTIFVMRYENNKYESIFTEKSKVLSYADQLIQKIITDSEYIQTFNVDFRKDAKPQTFFVKEDDYSTYIKLETIKFEETKIEETKSVSSDDVTNRFDDSDSSTGAKNKVIGKTFYMKDISSSESSDNESVKLQPVEKKHKTTVKNVKTKISPSQKEGVTNKIKKKK